MDEVMFRSDFPVGNHTWQTLLSSHAYLSLFYYYFFFKSVTFLSAFLPGGFSLVSKHSLQLIFLLQICPCNAWIVVSCDFVAVVLSDFTFTVYKVGSGELTQTS